VLTIAKSRIYNGPFATRQLIKNNNIHLPKDTRVACYSFCSISNRAMLVSTLIKNHYFVTWICIKLVRNLCQWDTIKSSGRSLYCRL